MDFDSAAADKAERQARLVKALAFAPVESAGAREQLEELLDRETLADLDERVLALVTGETEPEPEPPILDAVAAAQEAKRRALVNALRGRGGTAPADSGSGSLDGGARQTTRRPETHAETLARLLRDRSADVGARL
jgi:hypothetical protein